jgi:uncharacterized membrane protein
MEAALHSVARHVALGLDGISVLLVAAGALEALVELIRYLGGPKRGVERRRIWLGLANWLVAALTFQLGADIVRTIIDSSWEEIGRVGAIAVIRTFLTYFLERDIEATRAEQHEARGGRDAAG